MPATPRFDLRPGVTEPVVLMISRRQVEQHDVASVLKQLKPLLATREDSWLYRGQMSLMVDGYNDDPRALVDVAEVRAFLRAFEGRWPYWAFFFNQVDDSIKILGSCVCGASYPGRGAVEMDATQLRDFLLRGFAGMNSLFERHGFPESELEVMRRGVIEVIEQAGMAWRDQLSPATRHRSSCPAAALQAGLELPACAQAQAGRKCGASWHEHPPGRLHQLGQQPGAGLRRACESP